MSNETNSPFTGQHGPTGFSGRTANSARAEMAQAGRNFSALVSVGDKPASYSRSDMPTSREFLAHQFKQQVQAETSAWHDHQTGTAMYVNGVSAEGNPHGFLSAHGFHAVNSKGEPVHPSAAQARALIGRYLDSQARGGSESVTVTDNGLPAHLATVHLRHGVIRAD
jgi:hypothetical protein